MKYDTVILAGGEKTKITMEPEVTNKARLLIHNRPMVEYVLAALSASPSIGRIVITGPQEIVSREWMDKVYAIIPEQGSAMKNVMAAIDFLHPDGKILIVTSDIPMLTPEAVEDFLKQCGERPGDIYYPIVSKEDNDRKYPGVKRTYVKLREGTFTGANAFLADPKVIRANLAIAEKMVELRKNPLEMCKLLGWGLVIKLLLGLLSIKEIEKRAGELFNLTGHAIISHYPELGTDVDKDSDLALARRVIPPNQIPLSQ